MKSVCKGIVIAMFATGSGSWTAVIGQAESPIALTHADDDEKRGKEAIETFLISCVSNRLTSINDHKLAIKKSKTTAIRDFAVKMLNEDERLLRETNALASKLDITTPTHSSDRARPELERADGSDFDEKYAKIMASDIERDVEMFRAAAECDDRWVRAFAAANMSLIENRLVQIRSINLKSANNQ
jgi:predicted outer membrane protein